MNSAESLYAAAQQVLPGGVTASFRVNRAIGRPFYVARGDGPRARGGRSGAPLTAGGRWRPVAPAAERDG
jgi:hypothetical protein